ncbi:H/ACA small nucleolar RNP component GAR1 [Trachipleistophora hominis]|uniref:H/ACA ribonucleoprotein complex subunit n=1 Tax=Trachipleistophora hominis TaxID=72359 RepID=L7K0E6_TRAHO|nr:H/ACA small nucleolar RNP component GAR1 [Trachipleistophora hominis]
MFSIQPNNITVIHKIVSFNHPMRSSSHPAKQRFTNAQKIILGTFSHRVNDLMVLRLTTKDVPYPNTKVYAEKGVGTVDEIFGKLDEMYCSVRGLKDGTRFYVEENRFIPRARLDGGNGPVVNNKAKGKDKNKMKRTEVTFRRKNEQVVKGDGYNFRIRRKNKR